MAHIHIDLSVKMNFLLVSVAEDSVVLLSTDLDTFLVIAKTAHED